MTDPNDPSADNSGSAVPRVWRLPWKAMGWAWSLIPAAVILGAILYIFKDEIADLYLGVLPEGEGMIIVDSPEVYTRERLINDRLEEHLWLDTQLKAATSTKQIFDGYVGHLRSIKVGSADPPTNVGAAESEAEESSTIAFDEEFRLRSAIRDQIRQRILENQLDDRHDLYGNSLYILKFDTTVIPPRHSNKRAYIRVAIGIPSMYDAVRRQTSLPPAAAVRSSASTEALTYYRDGPQKLQEWLDLFKRWRLDLATRLDESVAKESEGFMLQRWKSADYEELRSYIRSRLAATPGTAPKLLNLWTGEAKSKPALHALMGYSEDYQVDFSKLIAEFFGERALKLVLGLQISAASYNEKQIRWVAGQLLYSVDPLAQYVDIYMHPPANLGDSPDFSVEMRWDEVHVTDDQCRQAPISAQNVAPQATNASTGDIPRGMTKFSMVDRWEKEKRNIFSQVNSQYRLTPDLYETMKKRENLFALEPSARDSFGYINCSTVEPVSIPSGLFNFIEKIARADLYSYAVLPRQSVRATVSEILKRFRVSDVNVGSIGQNGSVTVGAETEEQKAGAGLRATVTSFAATGKYGNGPEDQPEFGWIFDPKSSSFRATEQSPMSESMVAIVSVPAWWEELHLYVETGWISEDGVWTPTPRAARLESDSLDAAQDDDESSDQLASADRQTISVVLPNSYEGIDAFLLQVKRRKPVIVEADFEQDELIACAPANLLIRGNRLWRNSVVTLGSQEATTIKVMPNMDGILATFSRIEIPHKLIGNFGLVKLRVWTSEGMAELRQDIKIIVPATVSRENQALKNCGSTNDEPLGSAAKAD